MPRKFSGVPHVGRRTETKPDGTRYIYERTALYDQQTKKVKVLHCKLLGKIPPGDGKSEITIMSQALLSETLPPSINRQQTERA